MLNNWERSYSYHLDLQYFDPKYSDDVYPARCIRMILASSLFVWQTDMAAHRWLGLSHFFFWLVIKGLRLAYGHTYFLLDLELAVLCWLLIIVRCLFVSQLLSIFGWLFVCWLCVTTIWLIDRNHLLYDVWLSLTIKGLHIKVVHYNLLLAPQVGWWVPSRWGRGQWGGARLARLVQQGQFQFENSEFLPTNWFESATLLLFETFKK